MLYTHNNIDKIIFLLNSFRVVKQKPNSMPRREIGDRLSLWGYAPHARGSFSFTRKGTKSVSKGIPLRYPLGEVSPAVTASGHAPPLCR